MYLTPHNDKIWQSSRLRTHRHNRSSGLFFITKCLKPRKPVLLTQNLASEIVNALLFNVKVKRIRLDSFVVMPDHWHAVFHVQKECPLGKTMNHFDRWLARQTRLVIQQAGSDWQDGYHDTRVRTAKQLLYVRGYVERNPVDKELIEDRRDWEWSSANPVYQEHLFRDWKLQ